MLCQGPAFSRSSGRRPALEPGSMRNRGSHPVFSAFWLRPQRISREWGKKVASGVSSNSGAHWNTACLPAPGAPVCDCWATLSHESPPVWSGMGQELEFGTSFPGGIPGYWPGNHILRPSGLVASANIAGFFPGPEAFLSTPPPTGSFTSGCQRGGTSLVSPGSWKVPRRVD